jgi:hypothetical protein
MAECSIVEIDLPNLIINPENPRFDPVGNQREAIRQLVEEQGKKIFNLARDIAEEGLNPSEIPIVVPYDESSGQYRILEGNRRITAIKLLSTPELHDILRKEHQNEIEKIQKEIKTPLPSKIMCVSFDNEADAYGWIENRHMGEQDGVGVVRWDLRQQERFRQKIGKEPQNPYAVQVITFLKEFYDEKETHERLDKVPLSTLTRLLEDRNVRKIIGVEKEEGKLVTALPDEEVAKGLKKIVDDLLDGDIHVKDVYTKQDRVKYTGTFTDKDKPDLSKTTGKWEIEKREKSGKKEKVIKKKKPTTKSTDRKELIPIQRTVEIKNTKINNLFNELRGLSVDNFPLCGSVALRVILELSIETYIQEKGIVLARGKDKLINKISVVSDDFEKNNIMTKQEMKPIKRAISKETSLLHTSTLHAYVHDLIDSPAPNDLKITWDMMECFFIKIWNQLK